MQRFLFTTLVSNDLGLLTRSLPVVQELARRGHQVAFCNPAPAPAKLIAEAGFENLMPKHPLYFVSAERLSLGGFLRVTKRGRRECGGLVSFWSKLIRSLPTKLAPGTTDIWDINESGRLRSHHSPGPAPERRQGRRQAACACSPA